MSFTDIFVRRPVLASVVSLLILLIGLRSVALLELREYPETKTTVVKVTTAYPGADADLVQSFITAPLQRAISEAEGIDYLTSTSTQGTSIIEAHMELNYDPNAAISEIQAKVASQRRVLPEESEDPVIDSTTGDSFALMYLAFYSETMNPAQITDYMLRVVQPKLQAVPGVAKAQVNGSQAFAMRIWLNPQQMAALGVTATDVRDALRNNNFLAGVGQTKGDYLSINLSATTDITDEDAFRDLIIRQEGATLVRLRDIAEVQLGSRNYDMTSWYNGKSAVMLGVEQAPGSNPMTVANAVRKILPDIERQLPTGMQFFLPHDASEFIQDSINEVFITLGEAVIIVLIVIFISLGSWHAAIVPAVSVPLSLIGGAFLMLLFGFSINLLTLLAMLLAIGLVVDDAIVVVENVHRHVANGKKPIKAAIDGARELAMPIISMTTTLLAVYAPIGFMGGLIGTLFVEFAFALAGAVLISGIVALTLSPMLASKVLKESAQPSRFERMVENFFEKLAARYKRMLSGSLNYQPVTFLFAAVIVASIFFMFTTSKSELAPIEDRSLVSVSIKAPETATIEYVTTYGRQVLEAYESVPEYLRSFITFGGGGSPATSFGGYKMLPVDQRERTQAEIQQELQYKLAQIAGLKIAVFPRPPLPGTGGGTPIQFVIQTDQDYGALDDVATDLIPAAYATGKFVFLSKSIELTLPRTKVVIDRDKAGDLGIDMEDIGISLSTMLGDNNVNRFSLAGRSYEVVPQVAREYRTNFEMLDEYYVRSAFGGLVPLSGLVSFEQSVEPSQRTQFNQLNSLTINGVMAPGVSLGEALEALENAAEAQFPQGFTHEYTGESRQFIEQGNALIVTFFLSVLVIYLVLAAQFESWRDPLIILVSVPLSIAGALIFVTLGLASINIYTQLGLITLIGLIAKNGILIVDFANRLRVERGLNKHDAVLEAGAIRLRPILMTTVAMLMAMVPLLTATGPGAASRFQIGLVIATGLGIGTIFTLFVVPAFYLLLARERLPEKKADPSTSTVPAV